MATELKKNMYRELSKSGIKTIYARYAKHNVASRKTIEKLPHEILGTLQYRKILYTHKIKYSKSKPPTEKEVAATFSPKSVFAARGNFTINPVLNLRQQIWKIVLFVIHINDSMGFIEIAEKNIVILFGFFLY